MSQYNKNILLVISFLLGAILAYKYSFSKTFEVRNQLEDIENKVLISSTAYDMKVLKNKIAHVDSIIARNRSTDISLQNSLLKVLNENSATYSYKIIAFKEPHVFSLPNASTTTNSFEFILEGNYKSMEQILYLLERDYSFGSFTHMSFRKEKNYKQEKFFLQGHVLIQNLN